MAKKSSEKSKTRPAPLPETPATDAAEETNLLTASPAVDKAVAPAETARPSPEVASVATEPPHLLTPLAALWPESATAEQKGAAPQTAGSATASAAGVKVTFVLLDLGAKQVSLSGDFNGWSKDAAPMTREESGYWKTTLTLAPGRYEYKFVVDGEWIPDPLARDNVWNQHGTLNSVIEVRA